METEYSLLQVGADEALHEDVHFGKADVLLHFLVVVVARNHALEGFGELANGVPAGVLYVVFGELKVDVDELVLDGVEVLAVKFFVNP